MRISSLWSTMVWRAVAILALSNIASISPVLGDERAIHIGILSSGDLGERDNLENALILGLQSRGYVAGKTLFIERRYANSLRELSGNARQLAALNLDAIVTTCAPTTRIAKEATTSTPIVMVAVSDPVGQGLIESFAKPGGNVTGLSTQAEDLLGKRLALLHELIPKATTIAVLANAGNPVHSLGWQRLEEAARELKIKLIRLDVSSPDDIPAQIGSAASAGAQGLFIMPDDPLLFNKRSLILKHAIKHRLPDVYWASDYVVEGGLISYGQSLDTAFTRTSGYIAKIAKGIKPADLPVEQPESFELVINTNRARKLGIAIPSSMRLIADRLIE